MTSVTVDIPTKFQKLLKQKKNKALLEVVVHDFLEEHSQDLSLKQELKKDKEFSELNRSFESKAKVGSLS